LGHTPLNRVNRRPFVPTRSPTPIYPGIRRAQTGTRFCDIPRASKSSLALDFPARISALSLCLVWPYIRVHPCSSVAKFLFLGRFCAHKPVPSSIYGGAIWSATGQARLDQPQLYFVLTLEAARNEERLKINFLVSAASGFSVCPALELHPARKGPKRPQNAPKKRKKAEKTGQNHQKPEKNVKK
jgi:hypothetical protein